MTALNVRDLIIRSQDLNAERCRITSATAHHGSDLGQWGSHRAALIAAINLLNGTESALKVTLSCPQSEL
jgi:hypothetical protein